MGESTFYVLRHPGTGRVVWTPWKEVAEQLANIDGWYLLTTTHVEPGAAPCPTCDGNGQYDTSNDPDKAETVNCETCDATGLVGVAL